MYDIHNFNHLANGRCCWRLRLTDPGGMNSLILKFANIIEFLKRQQHMHDRSWKIVCNFIYIIQIDQLLPL